MLPVRTALIALVFLHPTNRRTSRVNHQKSPLPAAKPLKPDRLDISPAKLIISLAERSYREAGLAALPTGRQPCRSLRGWL